MTELPSQQPIPLPKSSYITENKTSLGFLSKYLSNDQKELQLPPLNKKFWVGPDPTKVGTELAPILFNNKSKLKHKTNTLEHDQTDKSRDCA